MADLRERLKALEQEWRELPKHYMLRAHLTADQVAAILAESEPGCEVCAERRRVAEGSAQFHKDVEEGKRILAESESDKTYVGTMSAQGDRWVEHATRTEPKSLPLGHGFVGASGFPGACQYPFCGQPRSAHEPKDVLQMTHYKGDNCPGGHESETF